SSLGAARRSGRRIVARRDELCAGDVRLRARQGEIDDRLLVGGDALQRRIEGNRAIDRELVRVATAGFAGAFEEREITTEAVADEREVRLRVAQLVVTEHLLKHGE